MVTRKARAQGKAGHRRTRMVVLIAAGVVVVALAGGGIVWLGIGNPTAEPASRTSSMPVPSASTSTATPDTIPSTIPSTSSTPAPHQTHVKPDVTTTIDPHYGAPVATTVGLDEHAALDNGVVARVSSVKSVTSQGSLPGEFNGPAVKVTVTITNNSKKTFALAPVAVNCYFGPKKTPAVPIMSGPNNTSFSGTVKPSHSASASYIFRVAKDDQASITVTVAGIDGAKVVVFG